VFNTKKLLVEVVYLGLAKRKENMGLSFSCNDEEF
jgi:hypothetical protein